MYNELRFDDSDSSNSDVEDCEDKIESNQKPKVKPSPQSGGMLVFRSDVARITQPTASVEVSMAEILGFDVEEINCCLKVLEALGKNPELFKLPGMKPLRTALHPLGDKTLL